MNWRWLISVIPLVLSVAAVAAGADIAAAIGMPVVLIVLGVVSSLCVLIILFSAARQQQVREQHTLQYESASGARIAQAQAAERAAADTRVAQVQAEAEERITQSQAAADARVAQALEHQQRLAAQVAAYEAGRERIQDEFKAAATKDLHGFYQRLNHEIGNTLQIIIAGLTNLRDSADSTMRQGIYEQVKAEILQLGALGNQLKRLTEIADEATPIERTAVDLGELLDGIVDTVKRQPKNATRTIKLNIEEIPFKIPTIIGDHDLLLIALRNLIDNAVKYTANTGRIRVRLFKTSELVSIEIADDGRGIPAADLPFIGSELRRGSNVEGVSGYGMGLAMVRAVVHKHLGQFDIQSWCDHERHGTVITVQLPVQASLDQRVVGVDA